ncbi:MAG TPA: phage portal protein [Cyclobacteriaceae bacterium]|jgi:capsid protein|nr:phage portal protein [Cyclobacteriaceae bacterium]
MKESQGKSLLRSLFDKINIFSNSGAIAETRQPKFADDQVSLGAYTQIFSVSFDGEKNLGEAGPAFDYKPDYETLRIRSWQAFLDSDIAQTIIKKYSIWKIGNGLKLQSEPNKTVLQSEGINFKNIQDFCEVTEARFSVYSKSKEADYSEMRSLQQLAVRANINAIVGGDCLVVLRLIDDFVRVQLIDGSHVRQPIGLGAYDGTFPNTSTLPNGNKINNGVEIDPKGKHIAYYVKKAPLTTNYERIPCRDEQGLIYAFMVYGLEYRLDSQRGIPIISTVIESIKKLERYKDATLGSAEERQKIAYFIEHGVTSTGEHPLAAAIKTARNVDYQPAQVPVDSEGQQFANKVAATTKKQIFNMPNDSTIKAPDSKTELHFKDFFTINADMICSTLGIPPDVAKSIYTNSFSASRAALKDWEHVLNVERAKFSAEFYQPIYNFWLHVEILKNKIQAKGYLNAYASRNFMAINAYRIARFVGAPVPHIDPVKEVTAERMKLGTLAQAIPLTTVEQATENLNGGESDQNIEQFTEELEYAKGLGLTLEAPIVKVNEPVESD